MSLKYNNYLIHLAKQLRKDMTPQENHLWYDFLRHYPVRFQRQKSIENYIVDFYCHKAKLVIEIDGSQHFTEEATEYDCKRTEVLRMYKLEVLRFTNIEITEKFQECCDLIHSVVEKRIGRHIVFR